MTKAEINLWFKLMAAKARIKCLERQMLWHMEDSQRLWDEYVHYSDLASRIVLWRLQG